jgi:dihydroflavonol-4-reductase
MRVFLTGGTGFIGGEVARRLRARGDDVVALARTPERAAALAGLGCELVEGDLADADAIARGLKGADAAIHGAALYEVGLPASRRPEMYAANVTGTRTVLSAALDARTPKVVYISSAVTFGNTRGQVADESFQHSGRYVSYYDETKHLAAQEAKRQIAAGLPLVVVQPGTVYGPGDHSVPGGLIRKAARGRTGPVAFGGLGLAMVHRDDVANGILLALDAGRPGESYVLGGDITTLGAVLATAAKVAGRHAPRLSMPTVFVKAVAPLGPVIGPLMGLPRNIRELVSSSDGVTFWATDAKARAELGYTTRPLEDGLRDTLRADGLVP